MDLEKLAKFEAWHHKKKQAKLHGRYINHAMIDLLIKDLPNEMMVETIGSSYKKLPIYAISLGHGKKKILVWSQMHGNESTGTKAVFDLLELFRNPGKLKQEVEQLLDTITLVLLPMLNPDGAEVYSRKNAQEIDLNRDAVALKAPESSLLKQLLYDLSPDFCFNLHDQRTIFSVGDDKLPASLSFLAPSEDQERSLTEGRKVTMAVITAMFNDLKNYLPGQIGRYTDEFYPDATGDNFQKAGFHTILVEAGHIKNDYQREEIRKYNFMTLVSGLDYIANTKRYHAYKGYFEIPNNEKFYLDAIYKEVNFLDTGITEDLPIIFKEELKNGQIVFTPEIAVLSHLNQYNANTLVNQKGKTYQNKGEFLKFIKK